MDEKRLPGRMPFYGRAKAKTTLSVSVEGLEGLDQIARGFGCSRSELIDRIGRGMIPLLSSDAEVGQAIKKPQRSRSRLTEPQLAA